MSSYKVKYKVNNSTSQTTLQLNSGSESEAAAKLKSQGTVPKDSEVIILSVERI